MPPSTVKRPAFFACDREAAINRYAPLVKYVVGRLAIGLPGVLDHEDILSCGTVGLIEAFDRFDDSKGVKFETYAISRIRGSIIDALRALDRLPRSVRQKARKLDQIRASYALEHGRDPTDGEVAAAVGLSMDQYNHALVDCSWVTVSLDGLLDRDNNDDGSAPTELPADPNQEDFAARLEKHQMIDALTRAVTQLPQREWVIVSLYYQDEMTMKEIAHILEISESRVSQVHARALSRLRSCMSHERAS